MTEELDYKAMYEDLKISTDAEKETLNQDITNLKNTLSKKDEKINELQTYICKNLSTPNAPVEGQSFEDRYKNALKKSD